MPALVDTAALAAKLDAYQKTLGPYPQDRFSGDGIVICAGGASIFTNAYVLISLLRGFFKCELPVEVWHFGDGEMSARMRLLLRDLSAETVDADVAMAACGVRLDNGWQLKSFALSQCSFERALLLDADIVPERNPMEVFGWPEFDTTGAVLWPDICSIRAESEIWAACGLAPREVCAVESGQILVDKSRHWHALQIIVFLNINSDNYYTMVYGDKDLFLIGFLLAGRPYHLIPHAPYIDHPWCLFQRDFKGERLFQHRTGAKWRYRGPQVSVPGFRHLEACEVALETLRRNWSGYIFNAPNRASAALAEEERLAMIKTVMLTTPGEPSVTFDLLEGGDIVGGGPSGMVRWYCTGDDPVELVLSDRFMQSIRFRFASSGFWAQAREAEAFASVLIERCGPMQDDRVTAPIKNWQIFRLNYNFDDRL